MEGISSLYVTNLIGLVAIAIMAVEIWCYYFTTWTHVITCLEGYVTLWVAAAHSKR